MATFTMDLKEAIDLSGGTTELGTDGIMRMTGGDIGLNTYPIWDEEYRAILNGKIIDHYWNREIGMESLSLFQMAMRRKMNEIMPYYNQVYATIALNNDPLRTMSLHAVTSGTATGTDTNHTTSDNSSASRSVTSDTPQTMLSGDEDYATGAVDANSATNGTADSTNNQSADTSNDSQTTGYVGLASDLIMRFRESLLNIDLTIITILGECFMQVWDNGDSYTY